MKKRAAILVFSDLRSDARVQRQILRLAQDYRLTVFALGSFEEMPSDADFVPILPVRSLLGRGVRAAGGLLGFFEAAYWSIATVRGAVRALAEQAGDYAVWIANDIETLPLALKFCGGAPVWFDAHEYSPRESEELWQWRVFHQPLKKYLCQKYIPLCSGMSTVSQGLAEAYSELTGKEPIVVLNAPSYQRLEPVSPGAEVIRLVHHGVATASRGLELIIQAVRKLSLEGDRRFEMHFFLIANSNESKRYLAELQVLASGLPGIHFHAPVSPPHLCKTLNAFDVGVISIPPINFNSVHCLPNKFFDFVQARIPVISGPLVEIDSWVKRLDLGWVAKDFSLEALVKVLRSIEREQIDSKKRSLEKAALECSSEQSLGRFGEAVSRMLERNPASSTTGSIPTPSLAR